MSGIYFKPQIYSSYVNFGGNKQPQSNETKYQTPTKNQSSTNILKNLISQGNINGCLITPAANKFEQCNGILTDCRQGAIGDCWFLSGLKSLSVTPQGKKYIKNSIVKNKDGSISVNFKGVNKSYTITKKEFENARCQKVQVKDNDLDGTQISDTINKYTAGDADYLIFELAMEKYRNDIVNNKIDKNKYPNYVTTYLSKEKPEEAGPESQTYFMISGRKCGAIYMTDIKTPDGKIIAKDTKKKYDEFINRYIENNGKYAVGFNIKERKTIKDIYGKNYCFIPGHAYSVISANNSTITVANPHNTSNHITIPHKTFKDIIKSIEYVNLEDFDSFDKKTNKDLKKHTKADEYANNNF